MESLGGQLQNAVRILRSPASWVWVIAVIAIQIRVSIKGGPEFARDWFVTFGLERAEFLSGEIWRIFTYGLLHGGVWHAGLNALFVLAIGSRIEHIAGWRVVHVLMLAGVTSGGLVHLLLGSGLLVGLSGGGMALLLFLVTISPESRFFPLSVSGKNLGLGVLAAALIVALIHPALHLPGLSWVGKKLVDSGMSGIFQLGHACHLGGGLAGWMIGRWVLRPRVTLENLRRDRARREAE